MTKENEVSVTLGIRDEPKLGIGSVSVIDDKDNPTLKGSATIYLNDDFVVEDLPIRENKDGKLFVAMPAYKSKKDNEFRDIVYPVTKEFREKLQQAVLERYEKVKGYSEEKTSGKEEAVGQWTSMIENRKNAVSEKADNAMPQEQKADIHKGNLSR